jgi:hypothetical protein
MGMTAEEEMILAIGKVQGTLDGMKASITSGVEATARQEVRISSLEHSRAYVWGVVAAVSAAVSAFVTFIFKSAGGDG